MHNSRRVTASIISRAAVILGANETWYSLSCSLSSARTGRIGYITNNSSIGVVVIEKTRKWSVLSTSAAADLTSDSIHHYLVFSITIRTAAAKGSSMDHYLVFLSP